MWSWADRMVKAVADVTVGTVIVLVHVAMSDRSRRAYPVAAPPRQLASEPARFAVAGAHTGGSGGRAGRPGGRERERMSDGSATGSVWTPRSQPQSAELDRPIPRRSPSW
jgi:hypothetical protein